MKPFQFLILSLIIVNITNANFYAIESCFSLNQEGFMEQCKLSASNFSYMENEGFYILETDNIHDFNVPCFIAEVRVLGKQLAFNTNTMLVKLAADESVEKSNFIKIKGLKPHAFIPDLYCLRSDLKSEVALKNLEIEIRQNSFVKLVEVNQVFTLQVNSNDPLYDRQWSIDNTGSSLQSGGTPGADMKVDSAWTLSQGNASLKIAILDSGVDTLHEDLINNLLSGYDGFETDSTSTQGYPTPNFSSDGHGTACAGIVAATANNNLGIAGIANESRIVPIRIFYYKDYGSGIGIQATTNTLTLVSGSAYAWRVANVDVMSTSAGLSQLFIAGLFINTQMVNDEINEAFVNGRNGYGVPMFFSAGK